MLQERSIVSREQYSVYKMFRSDVVLRAVWSRAMLPMAPDGSSRRVRSPDRIKDEFNLR
jgi:hypothetical protein